MMEEHLFGHIQARRTLHRIQAASSNPSKGRMVRPRQLIFQNHRSPVPHHKALQGALQAHQEQLWEAEDTSPVDEEEGALQDHEERESRAAMEAMGTMPATARMEQDPQRPQAIEVAAEVAEVVEGARSQRQGSVVRVVQDRVEDCGRSTSFRLQVTHDDDQHSSERGHL